MAEWHFAHVRYFAKDETRDDLQAFVAANEAYKWLPLSSPYRSQLILSLATLAGSELKVRLEPKAADIVFKAAKSAAPHHSIVLISRANYLNSVGRWQETREIIEAMQKTARAYPQTWMLSAYYYGRAGQQEAAISSLQAGIDTGGKLADMQRVAGSINLEIVEQ